MSRAAASPLAPDLGLASRRLGRPWVLAATVLAVAASAVGLAFALRPSPSSGPGIPRPLTSSVRAGGLRISVPRGFSTYPVRGGIFRTGGQPPLIGHGLADFAVPADVSLYGVFDKWAGPNGSGPPANVVALQINLHVAMGPDPPNLLHLPLTLGQPWFQEKLSDGKVGYTWGYLFVHGELYDLMYWSGPNAPATDRAAILRALRSIRPTR